MRGEVEAIRAALAPLGMSTYWTRVEGAPSLPYLLLWQSTGRPLDEQPLCGGGDPLTALIGVTTVALTPESAQEKAALVRRTLWPAGEPLTLDVPARYAEIKWSSFASSDEDRDNPLPATGAYPVIYVDLYRLTSLPA